uniref:Uncharacterized protein n=1 Tax=Arundo donax TaxID=35708 RepID=A0A0A9EI57_ARUDO
MLAVNTSRTCSFRSRAINPGGIVIWM